MEITPIFHGRLDYLVANHQPVDDWTIEPGEIKDVSLSKNEITIDCVVNHDEAKDHPTYREGAVILTVKDGNGRAVLDEEAFFLGRDNIEPTLGVRSHED